MTRKIKVVQCWDDGVEDDVRLCEMLREAGARATFNLNGGLHGRCRGEAWLYRGEKEVRRLARGELAGVYEGFTIANHTLTHPWPRRITLDEWRREVVDGRKILQDIFDQPVEGFVYPYGQRSDETDRVVREAGHVYARGTGPGCAGEPRGYPPASPFRLVPDAHFKDPGLPEAWAAARDSGAPVFYFWGHSYEMMNESDWRDLADLLKRLGDDPRAEWADLHRLFVPAP